jgi:Uma2 family endonuclease
MAIVISAATDVTVLAVGWSVYEAMLDESGDDRHSRLAYTGELLEIMSPSGKHEFYSRLLDTLIREVSLEWEFELASFGSVTLKAKPRGAEADSTLYVGARAALMRQREDVELPQDPPPDIVLEVDISRERIDKQALYAALGVPEFWRYDGQRLRGYDLRDPTRPEISESIALAGLPLSELDRLLEMRRDTDHNTLVHRWRKWLREHRPATTA